jgi:superfamily II DNA/RNA helicase
MSNDVTFESLNLHPSILRAIEESGYTNATPIQAQAIPEVMAGHDLMASAQTGTGKTAAFALPALNLLATPHESKSRGPRILVLVPTRELAAQVNEAARKYGKFIRARTVSIVGGMPYPLQNKLLSQPLDILVATPGRLIDHMERGRIDMSRLQMLILDEADRMLDMGFMPDVERICNALPAERQTLLFSATLDGNIGRIAQQILRNPKTIQVAAQTQKHENIEQRLHFVDDMTHKNKLLEHLLIAPEVNQVIVFTSTKRHADLLAEDLYAAGHKTAALHGDMTQGARNRTLTKLRHGDVKVLVATDVAARGIDVHGITHVINYDLPKFAEDYVHRIGRTGRAGNTGIAISFASHMDRHQVRKIEQFTGQRLEPSVIAGFEPKRPAPRTDGPGRGRPGDRSSRPSNGRPGDRSGRPGERNRSFGDRASERSFGDRAASAGDRNSRPSGNAGANTGYPGSGKPRGTGFGSRPEGSSRPEGNRSFGDRAASPGDRNSRPTGNRPDGNRNSRPEGNRGGDKFGGPKRADGDRAARRPRNFA